MSDEFSRRAAVLAATSKCMEVIAPLDENDRLSVVIGLVLTTMPKNAKNAAIDELLTKMASKVKAP